MVALLLIDIQEGLDELNFYGGERSNPDAERNCEKLLGFFREHKLPVIHVKNNSVNTDSPLHPDKPGNSFKPEVSPLQDEVVIEKSTNSAFANTDLQATLKQKGVNELIIAGLTAEHCISASARSASDLGYKVTVVSDATAAFNKELSGIHYGAETVHQVALANLKDEFADIVTTKELTAS